jgi:PAS domain S-box-containing protein
MQCLRLLIILGRWGIQESSALTRSSQPTAGVEALARVVRNAPAPMALFDAQRRFLAASKTWTSITNIESGDVIGRTVEEIYGADDPEKSARHQRAAAGEHFVNAEEEYVDADGERRWLCCEYRPTFTRSAELVAYTVYGQDITPMITARREAQASAERLSLALGAARAGVSEFDFANRTMWASPEFHEIVGVEVDFLRFAREPWYMAHPDDWPMINQVITAWTADRHEPIDFRILLPSGETRWVQIHGEQQRNAEGRRTKVVGLILDIDVRKRQELALTDARRQAQANAERLSLAMSAARAGVCEFDLIAETVWCSDALIEVVGRTYEFGDFGDGVWPGCHPDDVDGFRKLAMGWKGQRHEPFDFRIILPTGKTRWVQIHSERELEADGRIVKIVALLIDIDARKRQELALAEARGQAQINAERLGMALKAARAGVFEVSYTRQSFWCSPEFVEIAGGALTFREAAGDCWPIIHPEDRERVSGQIRTWLETFTFGSLETRIVLPSGDIRWIHVCGEVELTANGLPDKLTGLVLDVDARKRQESALTEARQDLQANAERLRLALDAARAGVFETNFATGTFWCSPEFDEIIGRSLSFEEALGVWPMTHPDDAAKFQAVIDAGQAGSPEAQLEFRIVLPDGSTRWIDSRATLHIGPDGATAALVGLVLDIDERKRQELALVEAERAAQAAAEAKSQFLANMSHEIRTPMNGVMGVLHLLQKETLSEEGRALLAEASNCGRMLAQLLNDVIDFSRIEAGKLELSPEPIDPAGVLDSVVGLLRPNAAAKAIEIRTMVTGAGSWISADPVRLRQALFNLIGNAVKFTPEGHVEIRLDIAGSGKTRRLRFEVEDTGVGIPEAVQATLFSRFQQADGSTSRRFGGSGLGLAITRRLAEMMDGAVGFSSREGDGSTFWLELTAPAAEPARASSDAPAPALEGLKVLLVEDNATNRLVASKMLEAMGITVAMAENGLAGLQAAQDGAYDLILMDVQMPVMDGLEATQAIRVLGGAVATTPIIGLTANALAHQQQAYLDAGMNGVVAKPISPAALIAELSRVMAAAAEGPAAAVARAQTT